jgi:hypothetical protein
LGGLVKNEILEEFKIFLGKAFVGKMRVFGKDVGGEIIMLVFAVEKDQVGECF